MLLPAHKLDQVDFYVYKKFIKHEKYPGVFNTSRHYTSQLTLYWKCSWFHFWRPRQTVIDIELILSKDAWHPDPELEELAKQLKTWSEGTKLTHELEKLNKIPSSFSFKFSFKKLFKRNKQILL